jgi:predicted TIM-barrel fold metal-dependent hydrolase
MGEKSEATVDTLLASMNEAGIDKSFVFGGMAQPAIDLETGRSVSINNCPNEWMLEQIAPHKDRLFGVAAAHPMFVYPNDFGQIVDKRIDEAYQLAGLYEAGKIVAVKFYTGYDHIYPYELKEYLSILNNVGCPAIFHSGDCFSACKFAKLKYAHPLHIDEVAVDFPNMNFIIAHMGNPWIIDAAEVCYKNDNVYADISGFVYGDFSRRDERLFKKVIEQFLDIAGDGNKLLFGTDFPISNQKSYVDFIKNDLGYGLTPDFLSHNVLEVFKLCEKK